MATVRMADLVTMHLEYKKLKYIRDEARKRCKEDPEWYIDFKMECLDSSKDEKIEVRMSDAAVMQIIDERITKIEKMFETWDIVL